MNSANIQIIDCYTNYFNNSEVFEYSVRSHVLNVITHAQQTKQGLKIFKVQFGSFLN